MPDLVRVRIGSNETTVGRAFAEIHKLEIVDEPAHTSDGRLRADTHQGRRVKPKTTVAKAAAKKTSGTPSAAPKAVTQSADNKKEQDQ